MIKNTREINKNIYIHIENIQKIDYTSLYYIMRIINETDNIFFFLECSNNIDFCNKIQEIFQKNMISINILSISKLEWSHVSLILRNLNMLVTDSIKEEYDYLNGNIKKLIFNNKYKINPNITINTEEQYILNFINIVGTELSIIDIYNILIKYDESNKYLFSLHKIRTYVNNLVNLELIAELNFEYYYITELGLKYVTKDKRDLIIAMLSNYYIPIIYNKNYIKNETIKGLHLLIKIYLCYNDPRLTKIIPFIEPNLLLLNGNKCTIDNIYLYLKNNFVYNKSESMLLIAKSYIKLNCFREAKEILEKYITLKSNLSIILYATVLIHLEANKLDTENYIVNHLQNTSDFTLISALYTCLVSLYMQIKPTSYVLSYIENLKTDVLTDIDFNIIQKNTSIYFNNSIALKKLNDCYMFFKKNNYNRLTIATAITLLTRYAQSGQIKKARKLLNDLSDNKFLGVQDLIYINNNLSILDLLEHKISKNILNKLKEAYSFCKDQYTHLLIINNLLIYCVQSNNFSEALKYVNELEKVGFNSFCFDDYLHLTFLNLRYYYTKIKDDRKINYYNNQLRKLKNHCYSNDLKVYIEAGLKCTNTLNNNDRWFYMSAFSFRPAFIGHWIINDFDC